MRNLALAALTAAFLAAYIPDIGHGFISDDFKWIDSARADPVSWVTRTEVGFYRPLVTASFAFDHALWGLNPFGYALTNLLLAAGDALLLFLLGRRFVNPGPAIVGTFVWAFNFHGINMALLWLSGRTALLLIAFALAAAHAILRRSWMTGGLLCLGALFCKEEAVLLPALFTAFIWLDGRRQQAAPSLRQLTASTWPMWVALVVYAALRLQSGAFGPTDSPSYYRFAFSPALVLRNFFEYADRAGSVAAVVTIVFLFAAGRSRQRFVDSEQRMLLLGVLWIPASYALTLFLPVRSALYALMPSVGFALVAATCASRAQRLAPDRFRRAVTALVILAVLLVPVYRIRNRRWVRPAELSARVTAMLPAATSGRSPGTVVLIDDPTNRVNFDAAFGGLVPEMLELMVGPGWTGIIVGPGDPVPADARVVLRRARLAF